MILTQQNLMTEWLMLRLSSGERNELGGEFLCSVLKLWPKDKRSFHYFFHASPLIVSQKYVMTVCLKN